MSCRRPDSICRASKKEGLILHHRPTQATLVGGISFVVLVWGAVLEEWEVVASVGVLCGPPGGGSGGIGGGGGSWLGCLCCWCALGLAWSL